MSRARHHHALRQLAKSGAAPLVKPVAAGLPPKPAAPAPSAAAPTPTGSSAQAQNATAISSSSPENKVVADLLARIAQLGLPEVVLLPVLVRTVRPTRSRASCPCARAPPKKICRNQHCQPCSCTRRMHWRRFARTRRCFAPPRLLPSTPCVTRRTLRALQLRPLPRDRAPQYGSVLVSDRLESHSQHPPRIVSRTSAAAGGCVGFMLVGADQHIARRLWTWSGRRVDEPERLSK